MFEASLLSISSLAAFYNGLKSKVGLAAAKTAAMRINLNIGGCGVVAPQAPVNSLRVPLLLANLLAHNFRVSLRASSPPRRSIV